MQCTLYISVLNHLVVLFYNKYIYKVVVLFRFKIILITYLSKKIIHMLSKQVKHGENDASLQAFSVSNRSHDLHIICFCNNYYWTMTIIHSLVTCILTEFKFWTQPNFGHISKKYSV